MLNVAYFTITNILQCYDAKYHRYFYTEFIATQNITAAHRKAKDERGTSNYDKAFAIQVQDIKGKHFMKDANVSELSTILEQYIKLLNNLGVENARSNLYVLETKGKAETEL